MDSYTRCECGSGEKYKFCCQKAEAYIRKVDRQIESELPAAAIATLEEGLKKFPDTPSLLIRHALLTQPEGDENQSTRILEAYLARHPNHAGVRNVLILLTLRNEGPDVAALELQRTIGRASDEAKSQYSRVAGQIAEAFLAEGKPVAAIAHATLRLMWEGAQNASLRALQEMQQDLEFSLWVRSIWLPAAVNDQVPEAIRDEFQTAFDHMLQGAWLDAAEIFGRIAGSDTSALSYRNQGLCMAMIGESFSAVQCLRAYAATLGETEAAVDIEALCQELDPPGDEDLIDRIQLTWPVRSAEALKTQLAGSDQFVQFEADGDRQEAPGAQKVVTFAVLDRPAMKAGEPIELERVPQVIATVTIDDRNASLAAVDDGNLDRTTEIFRETAASAVVPAHPRTKHLGKVIRPNPMDQFRWYLPVETPDEARRDFLDRRFVLDLETVWTVTPQKSLGQRTPEKAAADGDAKVALRAALLRLEETGNSKMATEAISKLRKKLGIPEEPASNPDSIERMPAARLPLVNYKELPLHRLVPLFKKSIQYRITQILEPVGLEILARPVEDAEDRKIRIGVIEELALIATDRGDLDTALALIERGQAEDESRPPAFREIFWTMARIRSRAMLQEPSEWVPELAVILNRKRGEGATEEEAAQLLVVKLAELGLIRLAPNPDRPDQMMMDMSVLEFLLQKYGPRITTPTGEIGISAAKSQIWTPGGAGSNAGSGGSSKIWTPGQSAAPSANPPEGGGPKLIVPGQ